MEGMLVILLLKLGHRLRDCFSKTHPLLSHYVASRPNAPYCIILLCQCLTPHDFAQWRAQWVKL
jgi:hypothetical protein